MDSIEGEAASIANRFLTARREARGLADYPGTFPGSLEDAYLIQDAAIARWGRAVLGWKVGRVPPALVEQFGTDRLAGPIFAVTFDRSERGISDMPVFASGFAAGEAEYLLRIGAAPPRGQREFTLDEAASLIDAVHVGIEIASSPLKTINDLGPIAVVSDFGNNNGLLVGPPIDDWPESRFEQWPVVTLVDGVEVGGGTASAFPDGAMGSARFLFELMAERGIALKAGQWISTGAVTGVHDAGPDSMVEAWFGDCHHLACRLVAEKGQ